MADTLSQATTDLCARMLRRLPPSLWDTDPASATVQRDLYQAIAGQVALWLEQREIARQSTLLLEAQGVDLDTLLEDYGLKRYLGLPDAYARQVAEQILFTPQGTLYSLAQLADLLLYDRPHRTLETGGSQVHVLLSDAHPITVPYSYWGLVSEDGQWYAVTVDGGVATIHPSPPPGLNVAPGPQTLHWFQVPDEHGDPWYVTIRADTLAVSQTLPAGTGVDTPFLVLDGLGQRWTLTVDSLSETLVATLEPGLTVAGYWTLQDPLGTLYALWVEGEVATIATTPPAGVDQTPGGMPLAWITAPDAAGVLWYLSVEHDVLATTAVSPGGVGTFEPFEILGSGGDRWQLRVSLPDQALVTLAMPDPTDDLIALAPQHPYEAFQLADSTGALWWFAMQGGVLVGTPTLLGGAQDVTPAGGPYRWLRMTDLAGQLWYAFPSTSGVLTTSLVSPGGAGTAAPRAVGARDGVLWHWGLVGGVLTYSESPHVDYGGMPTSLCLKDAAGAKWFWRVERGHLAWSPWLWPDTADQSPWGELGWLRVTNPPDPPLYVFPSLQGVPTAAEGPPLASFWGWHAPVTFRDSAGVSWHLMVAPTTPGPVVFWRIQTPEGVASLSIDAEVITLTIPPITGDDQTPTAVPLDWFTVMDGLGNRWTVQPDGDTLVLSQLPLTGVGTDIPPRFQDAAGTFWVLTADAETLVSMPTSAGWSVTVDDDPPDLVPPLPGALPLRDALDALGHIQAAGSLVTVLIA